MSTIVQTPTLPLSFCFNARPPSRGILLNGPSPYRPQGRYATTKSLPPNFSDLKIRFAPLPDPRNLSSEDDDKTSSLPNLVYSNKDQQCKPRRFSLPEGRSPAAASPQSDETDKDSTSSTNVTSGGARRSKKKTLLKNLLSVNTMPIHDATGNLGLNLFRSGSRDSSSSSDDVNSSADGTNSSTNALPNTLPQRQQSRPGTPNTREKERFGGFSFTGKSKRSSASFLSSSKGGHMPGPASASATLGGGTSQGFPNPPSPRSRNQPLRPTISAPTISETPIRMLNGRVYGSRAQKQSDWTEPEFVEWGYGGMGSVNSGEAFYGRVQSGGSALAVDDDYEASGMGWVKRRREERARKEREAKEKEEALKKEAEAQREIEKRMEGGRQSPTIPTTPNIVVHSSSEQGHVCRTVTVPHHLHSRHPSRASSVNSMRGKNVNPSPLPTSQASNELERSNSITSSNSSDSSGSSRRADDDDDEEEEHRDEIRVTSLCAGNEKISRHRE